MSTDVATLHSRPPTAPRIAIVGGGINGSGIAWELVRRGYAVTLFEKGRCGEQTSSKTTKMIHGGIRYLEHLHLGLVRESLAERAWLLEHAPDLVRPVEILLPVYEDTPRSRFTLRVGLILYDFLAGRKNIRRHRAFSRDELLERMPLERDGLRGGFSYWDAQVDDAALVRAVIAAAVRDGAEVRENTRVEAVERCGREWIVRAAGEELRFDLLVNAAGPWMNEYLAANGIESRYVLSLVRGSHIVTTWPVSECGALLQSSTDRRVFFVLPWKGTSLVGTTEVLQNEPLDDVQATDAEIDYLVTRFNRYMARKLRRADISATFAGVRPLVGRATNPGAISRDSRIVRDGNLVNVYGGKLTTFMSLSRRVALRVDNYFGHARRASAPVFA